MATWMKYVMGLSAPLMLFMVLQDTVGDFYSPSRGGELSYVVVETEEEPVAAEVAAEMPAPETEPTEMEPTETVEMEASEDTSAPVEEIADAPTSEEASAGEELVEEPAPAEVEAEMVAMLTPDEMMAGERAARACASCHQLERPRNAVGPHLVGVGGRAVGSIDGFRYSDALQALNAEGAVWTAEELEIWLEDPSAYAPGTKMNFKIADAEERRLIAGWLAYRE